jgi:MtfA peptidase
MGLIRNWRRRRLLERESIPAALWDALVAELPALARLDSRSRERLRAETLVFMHERAIVPAGGLVLRDAMRVRIAALACLPVLELGLDYYDDVLSVVVHPDEFVVPDREVIDEAGVVHVGDDVLSGEAWEQGPVVLAWTDVEASGRGEGFNVVVHEFAHKLDLLDGAFDGMPPLHREMRAGAWIAAFQSAYDDLVARLDRGEETWLDPYAAEEPAEFFAVCAELFFDVPAELRAEYPALYAQLAAFFRQDPARGE